MFALTTPAVPRRGGDRRPNGMKQRITVSRLTSMTDRVALRSDH
jgi:hypothetical protein